MFSESKLREVVDGIASVPGVIGIVLFGSFARGEADEGSDLDLLVLFEDEDAARKHEWEVTLAMPGGVLAHTVCTSMEALRKLNPVLLESIMDEGVVLLLKHPLKARAELLSLSPYLLVSYSIAKLERKAKQRIAYALFGKGERSGLVDSLGGFRVGRAAFAVPEDRAGEAFELLRGEGAEFKVRRIYARAHAQ